jgi:hypothetical protein
MKLYQVVIVVDNEVVDDPQFVLAESAQNARDQALLKAHDELKEHKLEGLKVSVQELPLS